MPNASPATMNPPVASAATLNPTIAYDLGNRDFECIDCIYPDGTGMAHDQVAIDELHVEHAEDGAIVCGTCGKELDTYHRTAGARVF